MKKGFITLIMFFSMITIHAQKISYGSFGALKNERTVSVSIDYSESKIDKVPFDIFLESEEEWDKGYHDILLNFVKAANKYGHGIKYITKKTSNYQLVFKAKDVDQDGETIGSLILLDKNDHIVGVADKFHARGGKYGSQMNLMGDASERMGKKVGKFIKKQVR